MPKEESENTLTNQTCRINKIPPCGVLSEEKHPPDSCRPLPSANKSLPQLATDRMTNDFLAHPPPRPLSLLVPLGNSPRSLGVRVGRWIASPRCSTRGDLLHSLIMSLVVRRLPPLLPSRSLLNSRRWEITTGYLSDPFPSTTI